MGLVTSDKPEPWMMTEEKYIARSKHAGAPTHCPLFWSGCWKAQAQDPEHNEEAAEHLLLNPAFTDWCPEVIFHYGKGHWTSNVEHYLDCPLFSKWWWERAAKKIKVPLKARSPLPPRLRYRVLERDKFTCQYCGGRPPEARLEVDHRIPVSKGGGDDIDNLITACEDCNRGKGDLLPDLDQGR